MRSALDLRPRVNVISEGKQSSARLGRGLRVLGLLPPLYLLLFILLFDGWYRQGLEAERLDAPDIYLLVVLLLTAGALVLAIGAAFLSDSLSERAWIGSLIALNAMALALSVVALGAPWSVPLAIPSIVALVVLIAASTRRGPRLSTAILAVAAVSSITWFGQAPCAEVRCLAGGLEAAQHRFPQLVVENHGGLHMNIVKYRGRYYAIHQGDGGFDLQRYNAGLYAGGVDGRSLEEVVRKLAPPAQPQSEPSPVVEAGSAASGSELVVSSYLSPRLGQSYNVYHYEDRFYAIRAADRSFDLYYYLAGGYTDAFDGASLDEVIQQLDVPRGGPVVLAAPLEPIERYRGYVIFEFGHLFYALVEGPEGMDDEKPFSVERFWRGEYPGALDGNSLEQVHERIDARFAPATLIYGGYRGYDIWEWGGRVFGIHTADGAFEIGRYERGEYAGAVEGASIPEAVEAIEAATEGAQAGGAGN